MGPYLPNRHAPACRGKVVRVMSYNIHRGGVVMLKQPLSQTAKAIRLAKADIVGIQRDPFSQGDTLEDLAKLLGWNHDMGSCIVTRHEIVEHFKGGKAYKGGIKVKLASNKYAYVFTTPALSPLPTLSSCLASAPSGTNTPTISPLSKPRQKPLSGPKKLAARRLPNF